MADSVVDAYQNNASANDILTGPKGRVFRGAVLNPGSAAASLTVYDNTSGTGKIICQLTGLANGGSTLSFEFRIPLIKGLSTVLSGAGATYMLYYE